MKEGVKEVLFSEEDISIRTKELAKIIDEDYKGKELLLVGVLKGSVVFISELLKVVGVFTTLQSCHNTVPQTE